MTFEQVKYYYNAGLWSKLMVKMAVKKGIITQEQHDDIVTSKIIPNLAQ